MWLLLQNYLCDKMLKLEIYIFVLSGANLDVLLNSEVAATLKYKKDFDVCRQ